MFVHLVRPVRLIAAAAAVMLLAGSARAEMVHIGDSSLPGIFTGTVSVTNQTTTSAVITVTLTNISPQANGGYLTGLAFNNPGSASAGNISAVTAFTPSYAPATGQAFSLMGQPTFNNDINASPYGLFDIGAAVGGDWLGGGQPSAGLAVGETGTFTFAVSGTGLNNLNESNLLAALSSNGTAGFVVRFRGFSDGSSDKDVAGVISSPPNAAPAPPGVVLAGIGIGGLLLGRFRRKAGASE